MTLSGFFSALYGHTNSSGFILPKQAELLTDKRIIKYQYVHFSFLAYTNAKYLFKKQTIHSAQFYQPLFKTSISSNVSHPEQVCFYFPQPMNPDIDSLKKPNWTDFLPPHVLPDEPASYSSDRLNLKFISLLNTTQIRAAQATKYRIVDKSILISSITTLSLSPSQTAVLIVRRHPTCQRRSGNTPLSQGLHGRY